MHSLQLGCLLSKLKKQTNKQKNKQKTSAFKVEKMYRVESRELFNCQPKEEPAILISRLLLRMHGTNVASLALPLGMNRMHRIQSDHERLDLLSLMITCVLTIYHVICTHSKALEQKYFDLRSLSPTLRNLRLLVYW